MCQIKIEEFGTGKYPITAKQLYHFCNNSITKNRYKTFHIGKKSGGYRSISAPCYQLSLLQHILNIIFKAVYTPNIVAKGFTTGKSVVDNAIVHIGHHYVLNIDIKDFFSSIPQARVWKRLQLPPFSLPEKVASVVAGLCCHTNEEGTGNVLPQGAATSPLLSNAICDKLDRRLNGLARRFGLHYSRYADDMTFSSMHNVYQDDGEFMKELRRIVTDQGFNINEAKTRLQRDGERQEVTGLTVNNKVNVAKKYTRDLRCILHIWEKEGYKKTYSYFYLHYKHDKGYIKHGEPMLENVITGKLNYLKMVKGNKDSKYLKLLERFEKLQNNESAGINSETHKTICKQSYTLSDFEALFKTNIILYFANDKSLRGKCFIDDICVNLYINKKTQSFLYPNINDRKQGDEIFSDKLASCYVSLFQNHKKENFWLISNTEPKRSNNPGSQKGLPFADLLLGGKQKGNDIHDIWHVACFLHRFTEESTLKYTTHRWDSNPNTGGLQFPNYDKFIVAMKKDLRDFGFFSNNTDRMNLYAYNQHLYYHIKKFLLDEDLGTQDKNGNTKNWGKDRIFIGYCSPKPVIRDWMEKHYPEKQLMDMPINAFPEQVRPKKIGGKIPAYFSDVINAFKKSIEFRDNNFYYTVKRIFYNTSNYKVDSKRMETLKGITFYTHTQAVEESLNIIADNINIRTEHPNVIIEAAIDTIEETEKTRQYVILTIFQEGSYSDKSLDDDKLMLRNNTGQLKNIKSKLNSICDFAIESRFTNNGVQGFYRIEYLYSTKEKNDVTNPLITQIEDCQGFKYIFKFPKL